MKCLQFKISIILHINSYTPVIGKLIRTWLVLYIYEILIKNKFVFSQYFFNNLKKCIIQGYVRERLKSSIGKFYAGRSSNSMKSPSPKCYMTLYSDTLNWSDITPICELITEMDLIIGFDLITKLKSSGGFHRTLQRVRLANRGRLLPRTPGSVPLWTCICSNVETIFFWACHVFGLWISNIPRFSYFA